MATTAKKAKKPVRKTKTWAKKGPSKVTKAPPRPERKLANIPSRNQFSIDYAIHKLDAQDAGRVIIRTAIERVDKSLTVRAWTSSGTTKAKETYTTLGTHELSLPGPFNDAKVSVTWTATELCRYSADVVAS